VVIVPYIVYCINI